MKKKSVFLVLCLTISMQIFAYECWTETRKIPSNGILYKDGACVMSLYLPDGVNKQNSKYQQFFDSMSTYINSTISKVYVLGLTDCLIDMEMSVVALSEETYYVISFITIKYLSPYIFVGLVQTVDASGMTYDQTYTDFNSARADYDKRCNKYIALLDK